MVEAEERVSATEDSHGAHSTRVATMEKTVKQLQLKIDDLGNRGCKNLKGEVNHTISLFADNVLLYLNKLEEPILAVLKSIATFSALLAKFSFSGVQEGFQIFRYLCHF